MVVEMVPLKGGQKVANRPSPNWQEKYHLYTTYSPCLLGGYIVPTTYHQNLKNPLRYWVHKCLEIYILKG